MDALEVPVLQFVLQMGNSLCNSIYESALPSLDMKPAHSASRFVPSVCLCTELLILFHALSCFLVLRCIFCSHLSHSLSFFVCVFVLYFLIALTFFLLCSDLKESFIKRKYVDKAFVSPPSLAWPCLLNKSIWYFVVCSFFGLKLFSLFSSPLSFCFCVLLFIQKLLSSVAEGS